VKRRTYIDKWRWLREQFGPIPASVERVAKDLSGHLLSEYQRLSKRSGRKKLKGVVEVMRRKMAQQTYICEELWKDMPESHDAISIAAPNKGVRFEIYRDGDTLFQETHRIDSDENDEPTIHSITYRGFKDYYTAARKHTGN
jgi:hypothetical protein